jgi:NADP-dependent 3-hydroxy acid dehydrogenase YdfG
MIKAPILVVTGGTKGIGKAIVSRFLNEGFQVFTCGSSESSVVKLRLEMEDFVKSEKLHVAQVDVADKKDIQAWAFSILSVHGSIEILVNNAGVFLPGTISEEEDGTFEKLMQTNLASAYHATRSFLPALRTAPMAHIFTICSTASIMAYTNGGSYCISKFGLLGMNKVLREELKTTNIRVTSVLPGATFTDSWSGAGIPETRFMKPEDVADCLWSAWNLSPGCVVEEILLRPLLGDL